MNREVKMQAAAFKDKKRGGPAKDQDADDPNYENITLTFRNQDPHKGGLSPPKSQVSGQAKPPSVPVQPPSWLYRAIMSLYILLALTFIFFIILSAMVLVKNSEMSQELLALKRELWNVSSLMQENLEERNRSKASLKNSLAELTKSINTVRNEVQRGIKLTEALQRDVTNIKSTILVRLENKLTQLETKISPPPAAAPASK
ncbi:mast cell-expressed membrane protein 1 [Echinops telfairi]|uniref:Mast cell-expressed membrane protein 1 n=1 Tax=Echinops telfairi TaxID=9371 RepID=A0AC55D3M2_ECHTE|nr:mast cell-expressed membrane protein 1 [Echinops telfairi]